MSKNRLKILQKHLKYPLLVKKKENLFYLTGRFFMSGYLLVKPSPQPSPRGRGRKLGVIFFGDGLEKPPGVHSDILKNVRMYFGRHRVLQIEDQFTFAEYDYVKRKAKSEKRKVKIQHITSPVDFQRAIKEPGEAALIQKSMGTVNKVFFQVKRQLPKKSWTEIELAKFIKQAGHRFGAEDVSFSPIVAAGANAAIPHHQPSNKKLKAGESIIIDFGFKYKGYCSDFTRTIFLKRVPASLKKIYCLVETVYQKAIQQVKVGVKARQLYQTALNSLNKNHLGKYFIHNLGHGIGLEIHELPNLSPESKDILKEGMVFSIEPGVYIPNLGGIRIEDLVVLKKGVAEKFINIDYNLKSVVI